MVQSASYLHNRVMGEQIWRRSCSLRHHVVNHIVKVISGPGLGRQVPVVTNSRHLPYMEGTQHVSLLHTPLLTLWCIVTSYVSKGLKLEMSELSKSSIWRVCELSAKSSVWIEIVCSVAHEAQVCGGPNFSRSSDRTRIWLVRFAHLVLKQCFVWNSAASQNKM